MQECSSDFEPSHQQTARVLSVRQETTRRRIVAGPAIKDGRVQRVEVHPQEVRDGSVCGDHEIECPKDAAHRQHLARLSHELRTPLHAIGGFAELLRLELAPCLSPFHSQHLATVRQATAHAVAVLDRFFATGQASRLPAPKPSVDVVQLVRESLAMLEADGAKARVRLTLSPSLPRTRIHACADGTSLRQILLNVLTNAVKYNLPGGEVEVTVTQEDQTIQVEVRDDGIGMTPEQLEHVFEPHNRLGRENGGVAGAGIGLALVRDLLGAMEGEVEISSTPNEGTRVRLKLPAAPGDHASTA